jgi:c-di-GMP-binding flagellar brake protein YcgR
MKTINEERRRFKRIFHDASTHLISTDGSATQCHLLDISLNGCLVEGDVNLSPYQVEQKLTIDIILGEAVSIEASAHIVFIADDKKIALQFDEIDIDSITALRRLVELNMGDTSLLERNLLSLSTLNESNEAL